MISSYYPIYVLYYILEKIIIGDFYGTRYSKISAGVPPKSGRP
jgi:hypothetical protein